MKGINRFKLLSIILVLSYLLSACSGAAVQPQSDTTTGGGKPQSREVSFTGTVEAIDSGAITVSGQTVSLDAKTLLDSNIKVGDIVKVEAQVSETGAVLALKVESFSADDSSAGASNSNDNSANTNASTDTNTNASVDDNSNTSANDNANSNDSGAVSGGTEQEISGTVEAITASSITIDGVTYQFASNTEFKDAIFAGDSVKLHVIVNADGSLTVREVEKSAGQTIGDDNSNSNDDNSNGNSNEDDNDDNSNGNSNDDDKDDNSNGNSNDDDKDDNSNGS
jgi:acyl-CoA hydrolase